MRGYRWIPGEYVLAKLVCKYDKPIACVSINFRAGVKTGGYAGRVIEWVQFDTLEDAKKWVEMVALTGAISLT